jgi:methyl-accepting chemotaxis protein
MTSVSRATGEVASSAADVSTAANQTGQSALAVSTASTGLADQSTRLDKSVSVFLARARDVAGARRPSAA